MFTLTINNKQLILDKGFKPTLIYKNPCWCFDEIPAAVMLDGNILDNDTNRNILGFPGRFAKQAKSNDRRFPNTELRWRGYLFIYGTLVISDTDDGYSFSIQSELRTLSDAQREKGLSDHELGGDLTFDGKDNYDPTSDLYCTIKLGNSGFWQDKGATETYTDDDNNEGERGILTRKFFDTTRYIINYPELSGIKTDTTDESECIVVAPFPFLGQLIKLLLKENKFFLQENFLLSDETLRTLCLYHNSSICQVTTAEGTPKETTVTTGYIWSEYYYNDPSGIKVTTVTPVTFELFNTGTFHLKDLLPDISLPELLLSTQNLTNTFFHFRGINDVDNIDRESLFDMAPFDLSEYRVSKWRPGTRQNLCLNFKMEHDSDDSEFSENFHDLSDREEDKKDAVGQYADLLALSDPESEFFSDPDVNELRLVTSENMWYEYRTETVENEDTGEDEDVLGWWETSIDVQDYTYNAAGDDSEDIKTLFSTLRMHEDGYPVAYQKGNSELFSKYIEAFTPRLLFYNGYNTGGDTATNGLKLNWKSLVANRYKRTAAFYANALPVEADFRFPGNIFYKIINEIYVKFGDKEGDFFIDEMEATADNSNYIEVTLTVFKDEDNVFDTSLDTIEGSGQHVSNSFIPKFAGVSEDGQPILVDAQGQYKPMPVFGELSDFQWTKTTAIDYSPAYKKLYVGGNNGYLHVYDLSDSENLTYRSVKVDPAGRDIAGLNVVNGIVMISAEIQSGEGAPYIWVQPQHASLEDYLDNEAYTYATIDDDHISGNAVNFTWNGIDTYIAVTRNGEFLYSTDPAGHWGQAADFDAHLLRIFTTENRFVALEDDDRNCWGYLSTPTDIEADFDVIPGREPAIIDGCALDGDELLLITDESSEMIRKLSSDYSNRDTDITPSGISAAGGCCYDGAKYAYIAVQTTDGHTKLARFNNDWVAPEPVWAMISSPLLFSRLFMY